MEPNPYEAPKITESEWAEIDNYIYANNKLPAFKLLREKLGSLIEANRVFSQRYAILRTRHPEKFYCTDEEYWAGFCS